MAFGVGEAAIDLTLEGSGVFNTQCDAAIARLNGLREGMTKFQKNMLDWRIDRGIGISPDTASQIDNVEGKAKTLTQTLRGLQSSSGLGMLVRGGIYGILAVGAVNAFTDMTRAAKEGASGVDILGRGIYGLVTSLPVVGRLAEAFKNLRDDISGAKDYAAALKAEMEFRGTEKDIIKQSARSIAKSQAETPFEEKKQDIENTYKDAAEKLSAAFDKANSDKNTQQRTKLQADLGKHKKDMATLGLTGTPMDVEGQENIQDKISGLGDPISIKKAIDALGEARKEALKKLYKDEDKSRQEAADKAADEESKRKAGVSEYLSKTEGQAEEERLAIKAARELYITGQPAEEIIKIEEKLQSTLAGIRAKWAAKAEDDRMKEYEKNLAMAEKEAAISQRGFDAKRRFEDIAYAGKYGDEAARLKAALDEIETYEQQYGKMDDEMKKYFLVEQMKGMAGEGGMAERARPSLNISSPAAAWASITNSINRQQDTPKESTQKNIDKGITRLALAIERALGEGGGTIDAVQFSKDLRGLTIQGG